MLADGLRSAVKGVIPLSQLRASWPELRRYLCDSPRKRPRRSLASLKALNHFLNA